MQWHLVHMPCILGLICFYSLFHLIRFLSTYQRFFLKTQREALFAELELSEAKAAATPPRTSVLPGTRRSAPSRRGLQTPKREKEEELLPRRQSRRLKEGVYEIQRCAADSKCSDVPPRSDPKQ